MTSTEFNYPFKGPISKYSYILKYWELRHQYINWIGGYTISSITKIFCSMNKKCYYELVGMSPSLDSPLHCIFKPPLEHCFVLHLFIYLFYLQYKVVDFLRAKIIALYPLQNTFLRSNYLIKKKQHFQSLFC